MEDILITPKFVVDLTEKYIFMQEDNSSMNSNNNTNYGTGYGFSGVYNRGNRNNNNNGGNRGYRAFQGHGTTLGWILKDL